MKYEEHQQMLKDRQRRRQRKRRLTSRPTPFQKADYMPHWIGVHYLEQIRGPVYVEAVKTAWRKGWIGLREEQPTKNDPKDYRSIGMLNIQGVNLWRGPMK